MSIRRKITLYLVGFSIVPLISIGLFVYNFSKAAIKNQVVSQLVSIADIKKRELDTFIIDTIHDLDIQSRNGIILSYFASEHPVASNNSQLLIDALLYNTKEQHDYGSVFITDNAGMILFSVIEDDVGNRLDDDYIVNAISYRELYIGNIEIDENDKLVMFLASPIFFFDFEKNEVTSEVVGLIVIEIDVENDLFYNLELWPGQGSTGETLIVRKDGDDILFLNNLRHREDSSLDFRISLESDMAKSAIFASQGNEGIIETIDYRGKKVLAAYRYINSVGWGLVTKIDSMEAFEDVNTIRNVIIYLSLFIIIIIIVLIIFVSKMITNPIRHLEEITKKIAKGDFSLKPNIESSDEIGSLSKSFMIMEKKLEDYGKNLEKRVKQRTDQLQSKTDQLERFLEATSDREEKIIELKEEINKLKDGKRETNA